MRHSLRLATCLIGVWFGALLLTALAATNSFRSVDSVLQNPDPPAGQLLQKLGAEEARLLLRHVTAESNRQLFRLWGIFQVAIAAVLLGYLLFGTGIGRISLAIALAMLAISAWMQWMLIPRIGAVSRTLDFNRQALQETAGEQFRHLHQLFGMFELVIVILGTILLARLLRHSRARRAAVVGV